MTKIALITGGESDERVVSRTSALAVQEALKLAGYDVVIFDFPFEIRTFVEQSSHFDFAWIVIHGIGGEDGQVVGLLEMLGLPYQCASRACLALTIDKALTKHVWRDGGLPVAHDVMMDASMDLDDITNIVGGFAHGCVIKALKEGSSQGLLMVEASTDCSSVYEHVQRYDRCLCEEFIAGIEVTVGILDGKALPVVEIIPPEGEMFDYENKYNGTTQELCPARLSAGLTEQIQTLALAAYQAVGCTNYGRVDMIIAKSGPVLLEINTIPGFTDQSLFPLAAKTAGISFQDLCVELTRLGMAQFQREASVLDMEKAKDFSLG